MTTTAPVVVTGGGSGIGRATASALVRDGRPVAVWDRHADDAAGVAGGLVAAGGSAIAVTADVTDPDDLERAVTETQASLGPIGGVVHAAGFSPEAPLGAIDFDRWGAVLDVNVTAFARLLQLVHGDLTGQPGSAVVAISSIAGLRGLPTRPEYAAAKHAVLGLVRSFAASLGPDGVRVNAVAPGKVLTPMTTLGQDPGDFDRAAARTPLRRVGTPEDVAEAVAFLLGDRSSWITGTCLVVDGGITATVT